MEIGRENKFALAAILVLPVFASVYYALAMPVSFDEAWTFLNFTQKGFAESVTHYPAPNNHVLHSLVTNVTYYIPFLSDLMKLRLPSIFISLASLLLLYRFVSKHFDIKTALVVVGVSSVFFLNIYYSYMSRGYSLVSLCFIAALYSAFNIVKADNEKRNWMYFSAFSIIGFFTMPSFLYPFITLNFFILVSRHKNLRLQVISTAITGICVLLLYLPIICHDGIMAIIHNRYVTPIGFAATATGLFPYFGNAITEITGIHWAIIVLLLIVGVGFLYKSKEKLLLSFALIMILSPVILLLVHRLLPFSRVFNYYSVVFILLIVLPYRSLLQKTGLKAIIVLILLLQGLFVFNFNSKIEAYEDKDLAINITASKVIPKIIGDYRYLFNFVLLESNLEFELVSKGYKNYSIKSVGIPNMSTDTISGYDFIIINTEFDQTKNSKVFYATPYYNIYKKSQGN
ncbi:MAG TPA: glycosyltransferase family 39 protein [Flavobacterium sp.]|nr:glycosyltransferase family 39 protein [Flavobacterium sp.]